MSYTSVRKSDQDHLGLRPRPRDLGGMAPVFQATKKPRSSSATGQVPWTHRRPGDPSSGCVPAEPDSVLPGTVMLSGREINGKHHRGDGNQRKSGSV